MKLYILRHGETGYNAEGITQDVNYDIPLTNAAIAKLHLDAPEMLASIASNNITGVICSPMLRAKQTLAELLGFSTTDGMIRQIDFDDDLHEVDFGQFGGKPETISIDNETMQSMRNSIQKSYCNLQNVKFPDGESVADVCSRCVRLMWHIVKLSQKHDSILLIGHNRFFRHLLVALGHWSAANMFNSKLPHGQLYFVGDYTEDVLWACIKNSAKHLCDLLEDPCYDAMSQCK